MITKLLSEKEYKDQDLFQIENDIREIRDTFISLGQVVTGQQEGLDRIEDNIIDVKYDTEKGLTEINKADEYQRKDRKKNCLFLFFCILFIVILTIIIYYVDQIKSLN